jgi:hypothetical protein
MRMLLRPTPAATGSGTPPVMTTCTHARCRNVRAPVPVRYPRGRVRHSGWTPPSDSLPDTACPVASGRTPSTPPGTPSPNRKRRGQRTDERHGRHSDIPDRHDHEDSLPGRRTPSSRAGVAAWQPRSARRWQRASATVTTSVTVKAAAWYCSTAQAAPRRTALLESDGWRVDGAARRHPLWQCRTDCRDMSQWRRDISIGQWDSRVRMDCSS